MYQDLVNQIEARKRNGASYFDLLIALKDEVETGSQCHFINAQLCLSLAQEFIFHHEEYVGQEMALEARYHVKECCKTERPTKVEKDCLSEIQTASLLLDVDLSENKFLALLRLRKESILHRKSVYFYALKNYKEEGMLGIAVDYAENPEDLRFIIERAVLAPASAQCLGRLRALCEDSIGEMQEYAKLALFIYSNDENLHSLNASLGVPAIVVSDEHIRLALISLIKRGSSARAVALATAVESKGFIYNEAVLNFCSTVKKFIRLSSAEDCGDDLSQLIPELASFYYCHRLYAKIYALYNRYAELVPAHYAFSAATALGHLRLAARLYGSLANEAEPEALVNFYLKTGDHKSLLALLASQPNAKQCLEYLKPLLSFDDTEMLFTAAQAAIARWPCISTTFMLAVASRLYFAGLPPQKQLSLLVGLEIEHLSEYQREWLSAVVFNNLSILFDRSSMLACKAAVLLSQLSKMDEEALYVFLSIAEEQPTLSLDVIVKCFNSRQLEKFMLNREEKGTAPSLEDIARINSLTFYSLFKTAGKNELAESAAAHLIPGELSDMVLLMLVRKHPTSGALNEAHRRGVLTSEVAKEALLNQVFMSPSNLYSFLKELEFSVEKYGIIEFIRERAEQIGFKDSEFLNDFIN